MRAEEPTLSDLVVAARAGDRRAFGVIYDRFHRVVHAVALGRVHHRDAADVVQDVFLAAWERLPSLREPAAFPGWLLSIARSRATDHARRRRVTNSLTDVAVAPPPSAEAQEVLDALAELPEAYRDVLAMRLVEGMSGPEIAERTGMQPGSVRVNLHRGMKRLRARLGLAPAAGDGDGGTDD